MSRAELSSRRPPLMWGDFDTFCADFSCTAAERYALAWHLAMIRARETVERLVYAAR